MNRLKNYQRIESWEPGDASGGALLVSSPGSWFDSSKSDAQDSILAIKQMLSAFGLGKREAASLRHEIEELRKKVDHHDKLLKQFFEPAEVERKGSYEEWASNVEAVIPFRGKHVAFVEKEGVIASADSLDELLRIVRAMRNPREATFGFVSNLAENVKG